MCLNRQCQNVSVFGVHECSAKCSGRGVSTAPFISFHCCEDPVRSLSISNRPPPRWLVYLISHSPPPPRTEAHFDGNMLRMPCLWWVGSHYNASQSITPRAERFNQLPIMASFMLGFKCHSSYAQPVVLVPKTASKSKKGPGVIRAKRWELWHTVWLWAGVHGYWIFSWTYGVVLFEMKYGAFVVLPWNLLADPRDFDGDCFTSLLHQSCRGNTFFTVS